MLQTQGLRPSDPYRTLQLHPSASRQFVSDVYWALIERAKAALASSPDASARIAELNDAYRLLSDAGRRAAYDAENGLDAIKPPHVSVRRPLVAVPFLAEMKLQSDHRDLYHLLRVDCDADAQVIELAYRALTRSPGSQSAEDAFLRGLLDEAHRTLSDRELRAQYDQKLATRGRAPAAAQAGASPETPPAAGASSTAMETRAAAAADERSASAGGDLPANVAQPAARDTIIRPAQWAAARVAPADAIARGVDGAVGEAEAAASPAGQAAAAPSRLAPAATVATGDDAVAPVERPSGREAAPIVAAGPKAAAGERGPAAPAAAAAGAAQPAAPGEAARPRRGLFMRLRGASVPDAARASDAARDRLLSLGGFDAPRRARTRVGGEGEAEAAPARPRAELVIVAGAQAGACVPLGEQAVTLATSAPAAGGRADEVARVWPNGDGFALRILGEAPVRVNGEQPLLPVVMLDDRDEIDTGSQTLSFRLLAPAGGRMAPLPDEAAERPA